MGSTRLVILIVAAVCSIGLAFVVLRMMGGDAPEPQRVEATGGEVMMQKVLVAKRDLKVGERLTLDAVGWQPWPPQAVTGAYITDGAARPMPTGVAAAADKVLETVAPDSAAMTAIQGSIVREPILASEPIVQRKLVRGGEGGYMAVMLQPGMRALSVPVTAETGVGGFILPNDRVDVILNQKVQVEGGKGASEMAVSKVVMRNLRVLAVDQTTEPEKAARSIVGSVVTLEVPAEHVDAVAAAKAQGELALSLRAYSDAGGGPQMGEGAGMAGDVVRVFRAGQASDVRVQ